MSYQAAYERLRRSIDGIAACGTQCECCAMLRQIAEQPIKDAAELIAYPPVDIRRDEDRQDGSLVV